MLVSEIHDKHTIYLSGDEDYAFVKRISDLMHMTLTIRRDQGERFFILSKKQKGFWDNLPLLDEGRANAWMKQLKKHGSMFTKQTVETSEGLKYKIKYWRVSDYD